MFRSTIRAAIFIAASSTLMGCGTADDIKLCLVNFTAGNISNCIGRPDIDIDFNGCTDFVGEGCNL